MTKTLNVEYHIVSDVLQKDILNKNQLENILNLYLTGFVSSSDQNVPIFNQDNKCLILTKTEIVNDTLYVIVYDIFYTSSVRIKRGFIIQ